MDNDKPRKAKTKNTPVRKGLHLGGEVDMAGAVTVREKRKISTPPSSALGMWVTFSTHQAM